MKTISRRLFPSLVAVLHLIQGFHILTPLRRIYSATSVFSFLDDNEGKASGIPANFNPFDYTASTSASGKPYSGNRISLRKTTMQQMVNDLMDVVGSDEETETILQKYKDFLLEPLDDDEAVLDPDSIYNSTMDRTARYQAYAKSMESRIKSARNSSARSVLESMRDFVLKHE